MANELLAHATSSQTLYAVLLDAAGRTWNGASLVTIDADDWPDYAVPLTEAAGGIYLGSLPEDLPAGHYTYPVYQKLGASPAPGDTLRGSGSLDWDGLRLLHLARIVPPPMVLT